MATIQIRDIPDDVYETIRHEAQAAGQSLQAYMRRELIEQVRRRTRKAAVFAELDQLLARDSGTGVRRDQVLADLDEDRQR